MEKVILIKYGELTTKKGNRNFFVKTLTKNIENKLKDFNVLIEKDLSLLLVSTLNVLKFCNLTVLINSSLIEFISLLVT